MVSKPQGVPSGQYFRHPLVNMKLLLIALSVGCIASPVPAGYLTTVDRDGHDGRGDVVEMFGSGFRMGGSRMTPPGVILVQHDEHPEDRSLHDLFYSKWHVPNRGKRRAFSC